MKYFFGFLICIALVVLVFILVFRGLTGGSKAKPPTPLVSYAGSSKVVRFTVDGPIVADQVHNAYRITVGRDETRIETIKGYEDQVIDQRTYDNNQTSYANFLRAIDFAGFSRGDSKSANKDERGVCAAGSRYIMEIVDGSLEVQRYWASSCGNNGNFKGSAPKVRQLFSAQIPATEFSDMTGRLSL